MGYAKSPALLAMALLALVAVAPVLPVMASGPAEQKLHYHVEYHGNDAGEIDIHLRRDGEEHLLTTVYRPNLLASLIVKGYTIESRFRFRDGTAHLQSGRELRTRSDEVVRSFRVDHATRRILFSDGDPVSFDTVTGLDTEPFPLALMTSGVPSGGRFLSVNPKRARLFETAGTAEEAVTVPAGTFATLRHDHIATGDPGRIFRVWMRQGENPVPVRIVTGREGKLTVMELLP